jgi:hypothetical protein
MNIVNDEYEKHALKKQNYATKLYQKQFMSKPLAASSLPTSTTNLAPPEPTGTTTVRVSSEVSLKKLFREWREQELLSCSHMLANDSSVAPRWRGKQELMVPLICTRIDKTIAHQPLATSGSRNLQHRSLSPPQMQSVEQSIEVGSVFLRFDILNAGKREQEEGILHPLISVEVGFFVSLAFLSV